MAFNKGDTSTAAQSLTIKMDLLKDGKMVVICANSFTEALNYNTETWFDLCSNGFRSSATPAIDLEYSGEAIIRYDEATMDLAKMRYDIGAVNNIPMELENTFLGESLTVPVTVTSMEITYVAQELIKISFAFKPFQGAPTITPLA